MSNVMMALIAAVAVIDCPKCDKRFRIADDGRATMNVARLKDDCPDGATLQARTERLRARAEAYARRARQFPDGSRKCPLLGWASWNTFSLDINEKVIISIAEAMATNGLKAAGYRYVNIDDGFFMTHDKSGRLVFHPDRFPQGMKRTVDRIHALGLKAGIYSDAGADTCGAVYRGGPAGIGAGLYRHDAADCRLHFVETGFDFIKVDFCGGQRLGLNERVRYTEIAQAIAATGRDDVRFNVCRWAYPGTWVADIADSWRTTGDIRANWRSLRGIIAENLYLSAYASPGHCNDMDMLEVGLLKGRVKTHWAEDVGFTTDEEQTHFGLWCMFSSPLMIGCDVRNMDTNTMRLVTNPYLLAMNQNNGIGVQGEVVQRDGETYVIAKDADELYGRSRYVALYNGGEAEREIVLRAEALDLGGEIAAFDLVERADVGTFAKEVAVKVAPHATKFYRLDAGERLERRSYEAESAFLTAYHELTRNLKGRGLVCVDQIADASLGAAVINLGGSEQNDLVWKNVNVLNDGALTLEIFLSSERDGSLCLEIDGKDRRELAFRAGDGFVPVRTEVRLAHGVHAVRLFSKQRMPTVDRMVLCRKDPGLAAKPTK